jgi:hypothetical protein
MNIFDNSTPIIKQAIAEMIAEQILKGLKTQLFNDWYNSDFDDFIQDSESNISEEMVLDKIKKLFHLN